MMEIFASKAKLVNSGHQTKHIRRFKHLWKCLKTNYIKKNVMKKELPRNNLTKNEIDALKNRSMRDDIIITKANKGEAILIIDVDDYINEANRQLNKKEFYKDIPNDPAKLKRKKSMQSRN